jgi:nucleoside-diphosphate-sugar epimerase
MNKKNILITGGCGYVGSSLASTLSKNKNYNVICVDNFSNSNKNVKDSIKKLGCKVESCDIKKVNIIENIVKKNNITHFVHLAAIVGDPACKINPKLANDTNLNASKRLYKMCVKNNIKKFIFSSTCSNYGFSKNQLAKETTLLKPLSIYAKTKVGFERFLKKNYKKNKKTDIIILRFATVYGLSPRMRFDLTVNQFTRDLFFKKKLLVFAANTSRPYCHVKDISLCIMKSINSKIKFNILNVGLTKNNFSKKDIVNKISKYLFVKDVLLTDKKDFDRRDYKVSFEKIKIKLNFKAKKSLDFGIKEIINYVKKNKKKINFFSKRFSNI